MLSYWIHQLECLSVWLLSLPVLRWFEARHSHGIVASHSGSVTAVFAPASGHSLAILDLDGCKQLYSLKLALLQQRTALVHVMIGDERQTSFVVELPKTRAQALLKYLRKSIRKEDSMRNMGMHTRSSTATSFSCRDSYISLW